VEAFFMNDLDLNKINYVIYKRSKKSQYVTINSTKFKIEKVIIKYKNTRNLETFASCFLYSDPVTNRSYINNVVMKSIVQPIDEMINWLDS
jgi:hypothetical protein